MIKVAPLTIREKEVNCYKLRKILNFWQAVRIYISSLFISSRALVMSKIKVHNNQ